MKNEQEYIFELQTQIRNLNEDKLRLYEEINRLKSRIKAVLDYQPINV